MSSETIDVPPPAPSRAKPWIYASLAATFFLNGVFNQVFYWDKEVTPLDFYFGFAAGLMLFWWYRVDAKQRGIRTRRGLGLAIILIAIIGLPYYLFSTRGFVRGLGATAVFIGGLIASVAITWAGSSAAWHLFQQ